MKTVKRVIFTAVALVALSGWVYSASSSGSGAGDSTDMDMHKNKNMNKGSDGSTERTTEPGTGSGAGGSTDMDMDKSKGSDGTTERGTGDSSPEIYQGNPGGAMGTYSSSKRRTKKNR